jgi:peroxiredoxin
MMPNRGLFHTLVGVCVTMVSAAAIATAAEIPRPSPDFAISMVDAQPIQLSQYKGKVCALAFILTTCPHCQKTVGFLSTMQKDYGPRGFQVLASAIEVMAQLNVPDFIKRFQPPFPVGYSQQKQVNDYLQHPEILRLLMPQLVFIDRQGTIRAQYAGDDKFFADAQDKHMREQIEALLNEAPAKKHTTASTAKKAS